MCKQHATENTRKDWDITGRDEEFCQHWNEITLPFFGSLLRTSRRKSAVQHSSMRTSINAHTRTQISNITGALAIPRLLTPTSFPRSATCTVRCSTPPLRDSSSMLSTVLHRPRRLLMQHISETPCNDTHQPEDVPHGGFGPDLPCYPPLSHGSSTTGELRGFRALHKQACHTVRGEALRGFSFKRRPGLFNRCMSTSFGFLQASGPVLDTVSIISSDHCQKNCTHGQASVLFCVLTRQQR